MNRSSLMFEKHNQPTIKNNSIILKVDSKGKQACSAGVARRGLINSIGVNYIGSEGCAGFTHWVKV